MTNDPTARRTALADKARAASSALTGFHATSAARGLALLDADLDRLAPLVAEAARVAVDLADANRVLAECQATWRAADQLWCLGTHDKKGALRIRDDRDAAEIAIHAAERARASLDARRTTLAAQIENRKLEDAYRSREAVALGILDLYLGDRIVGPFDPGVGNARARLGVVLSASTPEELALLGVAFAIVLADVAPAAVKASELATRKGQERRQSEKSPRDVEELAKLVGGAFDAVRAKAKKAAADARDAAARILGDG